MSSWRMVNHLWNEKRGYKGIQPGGILRVGKRNLRAWRCSLGRRPKRIIYAKNVIIQSLKEKRRPMTRKVFEKRLIKKMAWTGKATKPGRREHSMEYEVGNNESSIREGLKQRGKKKTRGRRSHSGKA